jgi:hypothetical protein
MNAHCVKLQLLIAGKVWFISHPTGRQNIRFGMNVMYWYLYGGGVLMDLVATCVAFSAVS